MRQKRERTIKIEIDKEISISINKRKEVIDMVNGISRAIVNPRWKSLLDKAILVVVDAKPRYRYEHGQATKDLIGGRMRLQIQGGELDSETVSVKVSDDDYQAFHVGDQVVLLVEKTKLSGWSDARGFGHVAVTIEGKLHKKKENK